MRNARRKVTLLLDEAQALELRREAMRRAVERGTAKADVSEIARQAIDMWLKRRKAA